MAATAAPTYPANTLTLSRHGEVFLIAREGIRLHPYYDSRHIVTTCIGHVITPMHTVITAHDQRVYSFRDARDAVRFFRDEDEPVYTRALHHTLGGVRVTRARFDMCWSLQFNIGIAGFAESRVAHYTRQRRWHAAADAFRGWEQPPELRGRRELERHRYLVGHW